MKIRRFGLILILVLATSLLVSAQETLQYGQGVVGNIDANSPQGFYTFNGQIGDVVSVYALGMAPDFQPTVALLGTAGQLAFADSDPFTPMANDTRVTLRLPSAGLFTVFVGSANSNPGMYSLVITASEPAISTTLNAGAPTEINIPLGAPTQVYSVPANPAQPTGLNIVTSPDFGVNIEIRDGEGRVVGVLINISQFSYQMPAGEMPYEVAVTSSDPETQGSVMLSLGDAPAPLGDGTIIPTPISPASTEEAVGNIVPAGVCAAVTSGAVNVRSGPGINYDPPIGFLNPNNYLPVTGQNSGWYNGQFNGQSAWVASSVTQLVGPCNNLPFVDAPPAPTQPPASTEEPSGPTATPTSTSTSSLTGTPTWTPTSTSTSTSTWTPTPSYTPTDSP